MLKELILPWAGRPISLGMRSLLPLAQKIHQNLGAQYSSVFHMFPSQVLILSQLMSSLKVDTVQEEEFNLHCNSPLCRIRLWVRSLAISAPRRQVLRVSLQINAENFRLFMQTMSWSFELSSLSYFPTLSSTIRNN